VADPAGRPLRRGFFFSRIRRPAATAGAAAVIVSTAVALSLLRPRAPLLVWNASPSSPVGLYAVTSGSGVRVGEMVVAWPPPSARTMAAARFYLPFHVPLVKRVAAVAGDRVCARRQRILINGRPAGLRRMRDPSGRTMPWWSGCRRLRPGELFLLSAAGPLAFDGRYFGVTGASDLVGSARLLWPKPNEGSSNG
jgi:conjugative transfer signal peptidase TraF